MNKELEDIYNKVLGLLQNGTKGQYVEPDELAISYNLALSKEELSICDKIDRMMQELYPDNTLTVLIHAKNLAIKGKAVKALELYESIDDNEMELGHWAEFPYASHCAINAGNSEKALEFFQKYLNHAYGNGEELEINMTALAFDIYSNGGNYKAIEKLTEMTLAKCRSAELLKIAANYMLLVHKPAKALEYLREASEKDPMCPEIWMMMTKACLQTMDYDEMREACRYYMALRPETRDFEMLLILADSYIEESNYELAMETIRKLSHLRGLAAEQRIMLTIITAQVMKCMKEPSKKIIEYLKRRIKIVGADKRINDMINSLKEE